MSDTYNKLLGLINTPPTKKPVKKNEEKQEKTEQSTNQLPDKPYEKSESQQNDLSTNQQVDEENPALSTKTSKRFTTYLTKESLKAIRGLANNEDKFDYEIFQEAVDFYLERKEK